MTEHHSDKDPAELEPDEARAGETSNRMRYVLGASLVAIVIIMIFVITGQAA